ncbi:NAD(P)-dependent alcohol dehydrogenase [Saccharibacillus kuerlensis]|uniref:Alcohol dehydrogenase n=1 Tax=Saccharibacillus kuerlensis TaxID=459527 RepID=A0ABQ2L5B3_9BACL|nr:NAD(P)-dependent alcohol dehydrogenase [Saccharibacillus kuerlensis]GGO01059.1 alcohol dehydrogenase [Saccharibacillus kuerlensis]
MKAVICTNYGPPEVLKIQEVDRPTPKDHEVLIKILAASAHIGDTRIRKADPLLVRLLFGMLKPKKNLILGLEVSGVIEAVGKDVQSFKPGDEVFGLTGFRGGCAEYICLPGKVEQGTGEKKGMVVLKPGHLSHEEAAVVPSGALTALKNLQKANIRSGQKVLIYGASGSLGTYAIQLAKYYGAEVTAVCSRGNFELVRSLGADQVIDYTVEDFTASETRYDIVYDAVIKSKAAQCQKILTPNGIFVNNSRLAKIEEADFLFIKSLLEDHKLKPVVDRTYALKEIVKAHRYVDTGRKKGNVAITIGR